MGTNVSTNYITAPCDPQKTLGIKLPFLVMIIKNLKKYFTFEVQVLDDKNVRRRFRASNLLSAQCRCGSTTGGTRSSSTCPTSPAEHMAQITLKPCAFRSTQIAASAGCISRTVCTVKTNCRPSSSSTFRSRTKRPKPEVIRGHLWVATEAFNNALVKTTGRTFGHFTTFFIYYEISVLYLKIIKKNQPIKSVRVMLYYSSEQNQFRPSRCIICAC